MVLRNRPNVFHDIYQVSEQTLCTTSRETAKTKCHEQLAINRYQTTELGSYLHYVGVVYPMLTT